MFLVYFAGSDLHDGRAGATFSFSNVTEDGKVEVVHGDRIAGENSVKQGQDGDEADDHSLGGRHLDDGSR